MAEAEDRKLRNEPLGEVVEDVMRQSDLALEKTQEALETGARVTAELNELRRRAGEALDWRKQAGQIWRSPWLPMAGAIAGAILLYVLFSRRS